MTKSLPETMRQIRFTAAGGPEVIAVETVPDLFRTVGNVTMDTAVTISVSARSDHGSHRGNGTQEIPHEISHARP